MLYHDDPAPCANGECALVDLCPSLAPSLQFLTFISAGDESSGNTRTRLFGSWSWESTDGAEVSVWLNGGQGFVH